MDQKVSERDAVRRVERLIALARDGRQDYLRRWVGKTLQAVVEAAAPRPDDGCLAAVSENYLKLSLAPPATGPVLRPGTAIRCRVVEVAAGSEATEDSEAEQGDLIAEFLEII
jgi:tRNA A37 methylthiotransferase MiaB